MPAGSRGDGAHYATEPIAEGVLFARARDEGTALSNSGIVDLGDETLVFDSGLTLRAARELRVESERGTGRPPGLLANSHWHLDHLLGNQEFPRARIHATRRTIEELRQRRRELESQIAPATLRSEVEKLRQGLNAAGTEHARRVYQPALRLHEALLEESPDLRLTPPSEGFDRELKLPGDRPARLLAFGAGHTSGDALLYLPADRILFAGDLIVVGHHPNLTSGDPEHWIEVLRSIETLGPERIAPGHGPLGTPDSIGEIRAYLETLLERARQPSDSVPSAFDGWEGREQYEENLQFLRTRPVPRR